MRGLMAGTADVRQVLLALVAPVSLTAVLAPLTIWLYRKQ
jgi:ABC-2 type transport system permease protein